MTTTNGVATTKPGGAAVDPQRDLKAYLTRNLARMRDVAPQHLTPDRLMRVALMATTRTPSLLQCRQESLLLAIMQCAVMGLEPNTPAGEAYLVPYGKDVQCLPGYRGLVKLARQAGEVKAISVRAVYAADQFDYRFGTDERIEHRPSGTGDDDEFVAPAAPNLTHAYCVIWFANGGVQFDVMTRAEIDAVRARSKSSQSGPWVSDYAEMAKKTVVRRALKMVPLSVDRLHQALEIHNRADRGELPGAEEFGLRLDAPATTRTGALTEALEAGGEALDTAATGGELAPAELVGAPQPAPNTTNAAPASSPARQKTPTPAPAPEAPLWSAPARVLADKIKVADPRHVPGLRGELDLAVRAGSIKADEAARLTAALDAAAREPGSDG